MTRGRGELPPRAPERQELHLLFGNFFERLFESDLVPDGVDVRESMTWLVPFCAAPAAMVTLWLFPKYALLADIAPQQFQAASRGDRLFFLGYSMAAVGFLTVVVWEALFPIAATPSCSDPFRSEREPW